MPKHQGRRSTVCQLLHSLTVGGAEVLAARIARQLSGHYRIVFACLDGLGALADDLQRDGFPVHCLERGSGLDVGCGRRLAQVLRQERVDLIHAHQYTPFFYAMVAGFFRRRPAVLFTEHGRWHPDYPRRKRILFNRTMLRRRDRVVGVGHSVAGALIDNEGIPARRVRVVYNGIDLQPFDRRSADQASIREEMGFGPQHQVLIQVARLDPLKDHLTAIRTLEQVLQRRPEVRLILVGEGPERARIEAEIERRGLQAFVRLLGLRRDVARLLAAADAFLLTSISEGIPLTLIEAMAAGLPVVSTSVGGVPEVVEEGRTGLLAPAGDPLGLAEAVLALLEHPARARAMGEAGRLRATDSFSEQAMLGAYRELYGEMLEGSGVDRKS